MHTGDEWGTGAGARPRSRAEIDAIAREMLRAERAGESSGPRAAVDELARRRAAAAPRRRPGWLGWAVLTVVAVVVVVKVLAVAASSLGLGGSGTGGVPDHPTEYADGDYEFMALQPGSDEPVGYNPCRQIPVAINYAGATPDIQEQVQRVITTLNQVSGLRLVYVGATGQQRQSAYSSGRIVVNFASVDTDRGVPDSAAGVGGSNWPTTEYGGTRYFLGGAVTMNSKYFAGYSGPTQRLLLTHEFGHALGLAHSSGSEVMNADPWPYHLSHLQHGDLTGLAKLGKIPCQ